MQSNYGTYSSYPKTAAALISLMLTQIRKKNNNNLIENVCNYISLRKSWDKKLTVHTGCQTSKFGEGVPQPAAYSTLKEVAQLSAIVSCQQYSNAVSCAIPCVQSAGIIVIITNVLCCESFW